MSKVVVRLHTKAKQGADYLDFSNEDLLSLNFEFQSTTDYSNPIYDTYPSYGTIEIQDKNLALYNMAINDEFNDYEYPVEIFVNNSIVGKFFISELPVYSYASKTLSITVGDSLNKVDTLYYKGYTYPLKQQTIDVIFKDILKSYDGTLTDEEIETILEESIYSSKISGLIATRTTYKEYLQTITVPYPYIAPNKTFRQAFQSVLTVAQCALITDKVTKYRLVRMDGNSPQAEEESIAILQKQMLSQFIPTIILPNKYNVCEVNSKRVVVDYNKDKLIETHELDNIGKNPISDGTYNQNTEHLTESVNSLYYTDVELEIEKNTYSQEQIQLQTSKDVDRLYKYLDNNLKKVLNCVYSKNKNPTIQITVKKVIKRIEGTVTLQQDTDTSSATYSQWLIVHGSFAPKSGATEEFVSEEYMSFEKFSQTESFSFGGDLAFDTYNYKTVTCSTTTTADDGTDTFEEYDDLYLFRFDRIIGRTVNAVCCEFRAGYTIGDSSSWVTRQDHTYKYIITYEFAKIGISYSGDYTEITFNDTTIAKKKAQITKENKVSIIGGDTLMQYEGSLTDTSIPYVVADNMLAVFDEGLNGGQLNAMGWDYYGFKGLAALSKKIYYTTTAVSASETSPFQKFFEIGDVVMPCKDNNSTPIITRGVDYENNPVPMYFQVVKNLVTFQGGKFSQRLTLREAKMPKKELTQYYPPTLSISGSTLTITPDSRNPEPVQYKLYDDDGISQPVAFLTTSDTTVNLANYITTAGTHGIYAVTTGTLSTSNASNKVQYVVALPTQNTPAISLVSGTTIQVESTDEHAQTIEVFADGTSIGSVTKQ